MKNKFVCLHLHFDIPPRENPWLGAPDVDPAAAPYRDACERAFHSCVGPHLAAALLDEDARPLRVVNNLLSLSFSFAPALLDWIERREPRAYRKILEADAQSAAERGGHGNAAVCPHPSLIFPSATLAEKRTALAWGLADFRRRFGRDPEALWLPEGAADEETLAAAAEAGLRLALLVAAEARIRAVGTDDSAWVLVGPEELDSSRPYRWSGPGKGRSLAVFFCEARLSSLAASGLLASPLSRLPSGGQAKTAAHGGERLANRFADRFHAGDCAELSFAAAEAEAFSRERFTAERAVAYAFDVFAREGHFKGANPAQFLDLFPPPEEVSLPPSREQAPPPDEPAVRLKPLREALGRLGSKIDSAARPPLERLFADPDLARDSWLEAGFLPDARALQGFLDRRSIERLAPESGRKAVRLLEALRRRLEMLSGRLWSQRSLSTTSAHQALLLAASALELLESAEVGGGARAGFVSELARLPSPDPRDVDCAKAFERLARGAAVTMRGFAAHAAITDHLKGTLGLPRLFEETPTTFTLSMTALRRLKAAHPRRGERSLTVSRLFLRHAAYQDAAAFLAFVEHRGRLDLDCRLLEDPGEKDSESAASALESAFKDSDDRLIESADRIFGRAHQGLDALLPIERRRAIAELSPPPGARGAALACWQAELKAVAQRPDLGPLIAAIQAASKAGIPPDSLPDIGYLRRHGREAAWGFADEGAARLLGLLEILRTAGRCGLHLALWELEACAIEGLQRMSGVWSGIEASAAAPLGAPSLEAQPSFLSPERAAPLGDLQDPRAAVTMNSRSGEVSELIAALGLSPALWLSPPVQAASPGETP
ncbi:MAG: DUF3536 domain-containing protein [Elusimicrobia bacterium]|nr:DUF3536 domain-containing protein [Elusimicrobiota bacterium]